ncbi:tail terminator [Mycobacterium phage Fowlmouth]|uniref:Tail terminator n=2 Tax=Fowlmouthvirus fowlmouth TaxID=2845652 RepID=A0A7G8LPQ8_9CAUD|nr:tail terminator [Mycobacterium phage Fowlmouth]AYN57965.1 tail terminator [Mycobacterium phage Fowlmouth]QNJ59230.1 tail terminator [Mycobacterium phage MrMiyagi]
MSRAAVFDAITSDSNLNSVGLNADTVFHTWSSDERPVSTGAFAMLRWGTQGAPYWQQVKAPVNLMIWIHYPEVVTNDYGKIDKILDRIDSVLSAQRDVVGSDGYTLSFVRLGGRSADLVDDGFSTITKYAAYQVFYR